MRIRNLLLLILLPTMIGGAIFFAAILSYNWYLEIVDNFKMRLQSAVISLASMVPKEALKEENPHLSEILNKNLKEIFHELNITNLYIVKELPSKKINNFLDNKKPYSMPVFITPEYKLRSQSKIMTAYTPIIIDNKIIAYMAAEVSTALINQKIQEGLLVIFLCSAFTLALMVSSLLIIATKIVKPIQKLNNSALSIAAGQYGERIDVPGPKELKDLSQTLNTMSECLFENINRLKENSLIREKTYGEYECAMLLQNHMLQKVIEECKSDCIAIKALSFFSPTPKGLLLDFPKISSDQIQINLVEAKEAGFEEMYSLLTDYRSAQKSTKALDKDYPFLEMVLEKPDNLFRASSSQFLCPFIWSSKEKAVFQETSIKLEAGDFIILANSGIKNFYPTPQQIKELLAPIFKFFAEEGLDTFASMLHKELSFTIKRKFIVEDIHLLCFQILY